MPEKPPLDKLRDIRDMVRRKEAKVITARTPEGREISFDLEKERQQWQEFYASHNLRVDIPELTLKEEEQAEVQQLIEQGYVDALAVIPDQLTCQDLARELTQGYEETLQGDNFKKDGSFSQLDKQEPPQNQCRLLFYQKVKELKDDPLLKKTLNQSPDQMKEFLSELKEKQDINLEGLSLKEYLILQRKYVDETAPQKDLKDPDRHLEAKHWTRCLKSVFVSGRGAPSPLESW